MILVVLWALEKSSKEERGRYLIVSLWWRERDRVERGIREVGFRIYIHTHDTPQTYTWVLWEEYGNESFPFKLNDHSN